MRSPEDVVSGWEAAWNAADADALAALFADDADFVNVVGLWWHDRREIRRSHAFGFETIFPGSTITMGAPRVRLIGDDAAVVQSRWHLVGQVAPDGTPTGPRDGIFTYVLERRGDEWITVTAHNTDIVPGTQTHVNTDDGRETVYYRRPE